MVITLECEKYVGYPHMDTSVVEISVNIEQLDPYDVYDSPYSNHLFIESYTSFIRGVETKIAFSRDELYAMVCKALRDVDLNEGMDNEGGTF